MNFNIKREPQPNKTLDDVCESYKKIEKYPNLLDNNNLETTWNNFKYYKDQLTQYKQNDNTCE